MFLYKIVCSYGRGIRSSPSGIFPFIDVARALYFGYHLQQALFYNESLAPFAGILICVMFTLALFFVSAIFVGLILQRLMSA
jgi:hypothetical protein